MIKHIRHYFDLEKKSGEKKKLKERKKKIDEIEVVVEKDRLQLVEWLKQLKK